jgi:putative tricarboxylic transport membrane protein
VPVNSRALLWTSAGLLLFLATLNFAGFIVASSLLFVCVTAAFGSRRLVRDAAIAVLFGVILYVTFTRGLGLVLPDGPW